MSATRARLVAVAATAVVGLGVAAVAHTASAGETPTGGTVGAAAAAPGDIQPPPGNVVVGSFKVFAGTQNYLCTGGTWVFLEPAALLVGGTLRDGQEIAVDHFGVWVTPDRMVPAWRSENDQSEVRGEKIAEAPASRAGSIPQLLLRGIDGDDGGDLGAVTFIQRLDTMGGVAPTGPCPEGRMTKERYTAVYVFWAAA